MSVRSTASIVTRLVATTCSLLILQVDANAATGISFQCARQSISTDAPTASCVDSEPTQGWQSSAVGRAALGSLGVSFGSSTDYNTPYLSVLSSGSAYFSDSITFESSRRSGQLGRAVAHISYEVGLSYLANGLGWQDPAARTDQSRVQSSANISFATNSGSSGGASFFIDVGFAGKDQPFGSGYASTYSGDVVSSWDVLTYDTIGLRPNPLVKDFYFPFTFIVGQPVLVTVSIGGTAFAAGYSSYSLVDAGRSAYWGGFSEVTFDGVSGEYSVSSQSGTDWTSSFIPSPVSEPTTIYLFIVGFALACFRRCRLQAAPVRLAHLLN